MIAFSMLSLVVIHPANFISTVWQDFSKQPSWDLGVTKHDEKSRPFGRRIQRCGDFHMFEPPCLCLHIVILICLILFIMLQRYFPNAPIMASVRVVWAGFCACVWGLFLILITCIGRTGSHLTNFYSAELLCTITACLVQYSIRNPYISQNTHI